MISQFETHPFHMVEESPWPIYLGVASFFLLISLVDFFWFHSMNFIMNFLIWGWILKIWSRDVVRESVYGGFHSTEVEKGLKWGMGWFITSEIFFFLAFFWGFFHFSLVPNMESGDSWPPLHIIPMMPFSIPLLNTLLLLSSGISLTWSHHSLLCGDYNASIFGILLTIFLGVYFTVLQVFEYMESTFCFYDSLYGSIFFLATGFHGAHVIIGTTMLIIVSLRIFWGNFSNTHHIGMEISSWYWHFVDVVWLFLFCCIYWWGS
uniref:Cytochrome c oxidase subunit 3 n=1 Tax=Baltalimania ylvae TaxID=3341436 RepID=A0A1X9WD92_9BILA|nr:cytochrome c oxidase subunit III [Archaphanostoma ylvae]ARS00896.1 cytochrome c oxidase subunit 3 [Archaphanostoma ylvae]